MRGVCLAGGQGFVDRVAHVEMRGEAGDLERPAHVRPRRCQQQSRLQPAARLDESSERGRVDEVDLAEVDHEPVGGLLCRLGQSHADFADVVEVELTGQPHDDRAVAALDRLDRRTAQPVTFPPRHHLACQLNLDADGLTPPRTLRNRKSMESAQVAARAKTENFPVASLLFPRALRPHLRAVYGFARLVDILGDEAAGDRLALLDELERELDACYGPMPVARGRALPGRAADKAAPTWPVMRELQPTIREFDLPREPFLRLIEANRMDQRVSAYETWDDLKWYCVHSADPVGRLVLGLLRLDRDEALVAASDDVCTGLQLVNFLQDVPGDLALGRIYLPAEDRRRFAVTVLDVPNEPLASLLRFEADRARGLLAAGATLREQIGGRIGRGVGLFARGGLAALDALEQAGWDIFTQRPRPTRLRLAREALRR
jgi:squalene synthase HpnC